MFKDEIEKNQFFLKKILKKNQSQPMLIFKIKK
jgi:hypothetical protein